MTRVIPGREKHDALHFVRKEEKDTLWAGVFTMAFLSLERKILPRLSLGGLLALTLMALSLVLHLVNIESLGDSNPYYTAAVKSMLESWHNFFFAAAEPGGSVTVDKPPLGLWVEALFAYVLGVSGFSTSLPNILAGVLSVGLLYRLVEKQMGKLSGLTAALVMALTPIFLATNRNNTMDGLLVFTLLLAAWAFMRATEAGKLRWLLLGAFLVGLGFNIKMLQAFLPLPAFYALYFLGAKEGWFKKAFHLGVSSLLLAVVSLSWALMVDFVPAENRPYIGSSGNNTVMGLILGHNGAARLGNLLGMGNTPQTGPQPAPPSEADAPPQPNPAPALSPGNPSAGPSRPLQGPPPAALEACEGQTPGATCSFSQPNGNVLRGVCITPPNGNALACAPQGMTPGQAPNGQPNAGPNGGTPFSNETGSPGVFRFFVAPLSKQMSWLLPFALISVLLAVFGARVRFPLQAGIHQALVLWGGWLLTCLVFFSAVSGIFHAYYAIMLAPALGGMVGVGLAQFYRWSERSRPAAAGLAVAAAVTLGFQFFTAAQYGAFSWWMLGTGLLLGLGVLLAFVSRRAAYAVILAAMLIIPAWWSGMTVLYSTNHNLPTAYEGRGGENRPASPMPPPGEQSSNDALLDFLQANTQGMKYLAAVPSSQQGAPLVLATGRPVLYMGGFGGQDDVVTAADLQAMVAAGELRYVLYGGDRGQKAEIADWLSASCRAVTGVPLPQTGPGQGLTLYDCLP